MNSALSSVVLIGIGGFLGAIARYGVSTFMAKTFPSSLPYGTLTVNLIGCTLLGALVGMDLSEPVYLFMGTGFCGAFTTFSTLMLESLRMLHKREWSRWLVYNGFTFIAGILFTFIGYMAAR